MSKAANGTRIIGFASRKGGSGKSTLCAHLAVMADREDGPALLIDTDPQRSIAFWHELREQETPLLVECEARELPDVLRDAKASGVRWVFIDGPPHNSADISHIMRASDFVLVPSRPSAFDLKAATATIEMALALKAPFMCVLNSVPPMRVGEDAAAVVQARALLEGLGAPVWKGALVTRAAFAHAIATGTAVSEFAPGEPADEEISKLWRDLKRLAERI